MRTNYILIDYENVQPDSLSGLDAEHFKVLMFVGANQKKLEFETVAALQRIGSRAEYVKISGNGPNALDFHIAFHIGLIAAQDPSAYFHIVSNDTGFDPLIQHLKERKVYACRSKSVTDIPLLKAANAKDVPDRVSVVVENLRHRGSARPRTVNTLTSTVSALFQKKLSDAELTALLKELQARGFVSVHDSKVTYALSEGDA